MFRIVFFFLQFWFSSSQFCLYQFCVFVFFLCVLSFRFRVFNDSVFNFLAFSFLFRLHGRFLDDGFTTGSGEFWLVFIDCDGCSSFFMEVSAAFVCFCDICMAASGSEPVSGSQCPIETRRRAAKGH